MFVLDRLVVAHQARPRHPRRRRGRADRRPDGRQHRQDHLAHVHHRRRAGRRRRVPVRRRLRVHQHDGLHPRDQGLRRRGARWHRQHPRRHARRSAAGHRREPDPAAPCPDAWIGISGPTWSRSSSWSWSWSSGRRASSASVWGVRHEPQVRNLPDWVGRPWPVWSGRSCSR